MPIELHILAGKNAGRRLVLDQQAITLGRDAHCDITIDLPYISREHAQLRYDEAGWVLANQSANGTWLNGKKVTKKPRPLTDASIVTIGDEHVLEIVSLSPPSVAASAAAATASPASSSEDASDQASTAPAPGTGLTKRAKLWIGIGAYMVLMLAVIVFFSTLDQSASSDNDTLAVPEFTAAAIASEIRQPPRQQLADERTMRKALVEAGELFALRETDPLTRYRAYESYRVAQSYAPDLKLPDSLDARRYQVLEQELIDDVTKRYQEAYNLLHARQYDAAAKAFEKLLERYPAGTSSALFENAQQHWAAAKRALKRKK